MGGITIAPQTMYYSGDRDSVEGDFQQYAQICCQSVVSDENHNLSGPQKKLLLWHWKLGRSMTQVQEFMVKRLIKDKHGRSIILPPVIKPAFASTPCCKCPKCTYCELTRAKQRNTGVTKSKLVHKKKDILSWDRYDVGDYISADQFVVLIPGRLPTRYNREGAQSWYHGGTIF